MNVQSVRLPVQPRHATDARATARRAEYVPYVFVGLYILLTFPLIDRFRYSLYPDATSYLSLADAYARGEFSSAVNGYWAPLYTWLLAPLLMAGIDRLLAPKLLSLMIGVATLVGLARVARRLALSEPSRVLVLACAVPPLAYFSVAYITPDFLLVCVLTWYLAAVLRADSASPVSSGLLAGVLGGIAYLSKQYALPFILAHLLLTVVWRSLERPRRVSGPALARWSAAAFLALAVVSGPWIAAMSAKYGRLTISAAGTYNWYLHGPGAQGNYNVGTRGLAAPPFAGAVSAWVDPSTYVEYDAWHTSSPQGATSHKVRQVLATSRLAAATLERFTLLALPMLALALALAARARRSNEDLCNAYLALSALGFMTGYALIADEILERLVWTPVILLILLAVRLSERLGVAALAPWRRLAVAVVIAASFWVLPFRRIAQEADDGRALHELAATLQREYGFNGRVATLNRYADSLRLSFFTGADFYGRLAQRAEADELLTDLRRYDIDLLLIWTDGESPLGGGVAGDLKRRFVDRTGGRLRELAVLDLHQPLPPASYQVIPR